MRTSSSIKRAIFILTLGGGLGFGCASEEEAGADEWAPQTLADIDPAIDARTPASGDAADAGAGDAGPIDPIDAATPPAPPGLPQIVSASVFGGVGNEWCAPDTTTILRYSDGTLGFEFTDFIFEANSPISIGGDAGCMVWLHFKDFPPGYTYAIESALVEGTGTPGVQANVRLGSDWFRSVKSMSEWTPVTVGEDGKFSYEERGFAASGTGCPDDPIVSLTMRVNLVIGREHKLEQFNITKISRLKLTPRRCTPPT